ncbi:DUF624 domain-containing protein [Phytoactinopolyspora halotolerans]|uniref:DUF624 domain-containing protein n=1 Tax=Phytoactinopolyspora halotolerans TaxID=1981512 RepID=A0A6L9SCR0_9ACTN|nr:DUF624 domain-containing protein [Phytoactinopolyspora halotolerans]
MVLAFTLFGGVVLGVGPALAAAYALSRRHHRGEAVRPLRDFAETWRREFWRGNAVILPVVAAGTILWLNYSALSALGPDAAPARLASLLGLIVMIGIAAHIGPMYAHFDLPSRQYILTASRFALAQPASTIILLFVFAAAAFTSAVFPVLVLSVSIGAWIHTSTWLCQRFYAENERRLAAGTEDLPEHTTVGALPAEPLRMR